MLFLMCGGNSGNAVSGHAAHPPNSISIAPAKIREDRRARRGLTMMENKAAGVRGSFREARTNSVRAGE